MKPKPIFAIAIISLMTSAVPALSQSVGDNCQYGPVTLERLAADDCLSRIPLPTPRPVIKSAAIEEKGDRLAGKVYDYVETKNPETGDMRTVRLVGARYLPTDDSSYQLRRPSVVSASFNTAFYSVAQLFGVGPAQADEKPAETAQKSDETQQIAVLEAQAEERVLAAHN